jgi:hypothetical protein
LHLRGAHDLAEKVGITAEVLHRGERDRVDALLDRDMTTGREARDAVCAVEQQGDRRFTGELGGLGAVLAKSTGPSLRTTSVSRST